MADYPEKEMMNLIVAMYQLSGGSRGDVFKGLTESEQTVCRSVVVSKLFFNIDAHTVKSAKKPFMKCSGT
jgi:hypothetical protein